MELFKTFREDNQYRWRTVLWGRPNSEGPEKEEELLKQMGKK
jgi:hypothetical protein